MPIKTAQTSNLSAPCELTHDLTAWDWVVQKLTSTCDDLQIRVRCLELTNDFSLDLLKNTDLNVIRLKNRDAGQLAKLVAASANTPLFLILEDWLQGYRRLIPSQIQSFYWYETYRLWPKIASASQQLSAQPVDLACVPTTNNPIFCFASQSESRRSLCTALSAMECTWIAADTCSTLPAGKPKLLFWYSNSSQSDMESDRDFLRRLVTAYPDTLKVRVTDFPRFESAQYFLSHGLDFEIDAAYDLSSILEVADRFSSAALRRK